MPSPSVLAVLDTLDYCAWWRILWPFTELRNHGYRCDVIRYKDIRMLPSLPHDILITPRVTVDRNHWLNSYVARAQADGHTWLYEADDDLWSTAFADRQYAAAGRQERERIEDQRRQRVSLLQKCNGVTVSSQALADEVRRHASKPTEVLPNLIDVARFDNYLTRKERMVPGLTVGWTGGTRLDADLEPLAAAWTILAQKYPEVTFVVYGTEPAPLMNAVPEDRLAVIEWAPIDLYPAGLKNIDIGCCVLPNTHWNACKSPNKWFEFSLAGVPTVCSPTVYETVATPGDNALFASTTEEWVDQLSKLIEIPDLREWVAESARRTVEQNHNLQTGWQQWPAAWERLRGI